MLDLPKQECQDIIDRYFAAYPKVELMMLSKHELAKANGVVYSLYGRPRRIPEAKNIGKIYGQFTAHGDLEYAQRTLLNLGMNHSVQSSAASIVNRAMIEFNEVIKIAGLQQCWIVLQVHDSILAECRKEDAELVAQILQHSMEKTTLLPGVDLVAVPSITTNLADQK
jgi:DNA polymerase-1